MNDSNARGKGVNRMKFNRLPIGAIQVTAITAIAIIAFYSARAPSEEEILRSSSIETAPQKNSESIFVSAVALKSQEHTVEIRGTGSVVVRNSIDLVLQLSGRVVWVSETFILCTPK